MSVPVLRAITSFLPLRVQDFAALPLQELKDHASSSCREVHQVVDVVIVERYLDFFRQVSFKLLSNSMFERHCGVKLCLRTQGSTQLKPPVPLGLL